jgi:hypothetical protein
MMLFLYICLALFSISSFAVDKTSQCLTNLVQYHSKYNEGIDEKPHNVVPLCADQEEMDRPFSSGSYSSKLKSTALPYGSEGILVLSNNEYHFVELPNKQMKMDETRYVQFKINDSWQCGKISKKFARPTFGHGIMGDLVEHFVPSDVGYNFTYSEDKKCLKAPIKTSQKLNTKEHQSFVVGTIIRNIHEDSELAIDFVGGAGLKSILASTECKECGTVPKALYHEYRNILKGCLNSSADPKLNIEILKVIKNLDRAAKPRGFRAI